MKNTGFAILVLAICVMMVAPVTMAAGLPKGEKPKKYSTVSGDFLVGPTQGAWGGNGGLTGWTANGGAVTVWNVPEIVKTGTDPVTGKNYLSWDWHNELFIMGKGRAKNGAPLTISPNDLKVGYYTCPGNVIIGASFYIQMKGWGPNGNVWLTILLRLPEGKTISIQVTENQLIVTGTQSQFDYYDYWTEDTTKPPSTYGSSTHDFTLTIDK